VRTSSHALPICGEINVNSKLALDHFEVDHFRRQGYAIVRNAFEPCDAQRCLDILVVHQRAATPPLRRNKNGDVIRLCDVASRADGNIICLLLTPRVRGVLRALLGPNVVLALNRHNHASPSMREECFMRFHRDVLQWSRTVVTAVFYLESADIANGCTWIIPGSQYLPSDGIPNNGGTWLDEQVEYRSIEEFALPVPTHCGDVLFFDSLLFHSVGQNMTDGSRWTVVLAFRSVDELASTPEPGIQLVEGALLYRGNELQDEPLFDRRLASKRSP
jgi:phytanoyl-CoA hydroxylase